MWGTTLKRIFILIFLLAGAGLFAHTKDVTYTVLNVGSEAVNGEVFMNGYLVARLAQQYNLDPSQLSQESLKNLLRAYFDDRFQITGRRGELEKQIIDFRNADPAEFLSSGLSIIFYVKLKPADFPIVVSSDMFFESFTTQTNKLAFRDKLGRPFPGARDVLLTARLMEFAFDPDKPDFSRYDLEAFDSDGEGIADQYEALYGLDPYRADTDTDGYSDFVEFFMGWDPFNPAPGEGQSADKYEAAIDEFARLYRRKPTESSLLLSYVEETQLKDEGPLKEEGTPESGAAESEAVRKVMKIHGLDPRASAENGFLALILGRLEDELFRNFNLGSFFVLLGLAAALGFFHTGASGPGKGLLAAYAVKDDRQVKPTLVFALAFTCSQLGSVIIEAFLFRIFFTPVFRSLALVAYVVQLAAGAGLAAVSVLLILRAVKRIRTGMVVGEQKFFDRPAGAVVLGAAAGLGAAPYFWSLFQFLLEIERAYFIPFFLIAYGAGLLVCLGLVALAMLVVRRIVLDILPKLVLYAELVSASLMLLCALFYAFIRIPI